ncbi:hypothetical protein INR49_008847 [Caranx melampygus]|nr:hypothetical protein INR49_008847 [Caranx melampygus]
MSRRPTTPASLRSWKETVLEMDSPSQPVNNHHVPYQQHVLTTNNVYSVNSSQPSTLLQPELSTCGPGRGPWAITMAAAQAVQATARRAAGRPSEGELRGHQEQRLPAQQRVLSVPDNAGYSSSALASTLTPTFTPTTASDSRGRKSK